MRKCTLPKGDTVYYMYRLYRYHLLYNIKTVVLGTYLGLEFFPNCIVIIIKPIYLKITLYYSEMQMSHSRMEMERNSI